MNADHSPSGRYTDPDATDDAKTYSMFMHIVSALAVVDLSGILVFIATLVMWQMKKNDSDFIDDHGREVVNFQISIVILAISGVILGVILTVVLSIVTLGVFAAIAPALFIAGGIGLWALRVVGTIRGAIAANRGEIYRYPMCIRVLQG